MQIGVLYAVVIGFFWGVFVRSIAPLDLSFAGFVVFLGLVFLVGALFDRSKKRFAIFLAAGFLSCAVGVVRMDIATLLHDPALTRSVDTSIVLEGFVFDEPDVRESNVRIPVRANTLIVGSERTPVDAGVLVIASSHTPVSYGDRIRVRGKLQLPESFETGLGRSFDYPNYLRKEGILYELSFAEVERTGENSGNVLKSAAIWSKQTFLHGVGLALPEPQAGLAGGITVGDKRGVGKELSETFRAVGLVHIIVLSGYNIMIVIEAFSRFLAWARAPRFLKFGVSVFVALLFALMTGGAAASVRAAAMAVIAVLGRASGRMYLASRALAVVALCMVMWNPYILLYDPGFQLSVLATAGLIVLAPIIAPRLSFITKGLGLRDIAAATLGTQVAVLPLLLYQNGQLPVYSLPANLLALIAVPVAMLFSAIASLAGLVFGPVAPIVALPATLLLSYVLFVAEIFGSLPFATLAISAFSAWWLVCMYGVMVVSVIRYRRAREKVRKAHETT